MKNSIPSAITLLAATLISCSHENKTITIQDQITELEKIDDSLGERNRLLLREYAYNSLHDKMTRDQAWDRAQEMKKIGEKRIEIQHEIDSLKLLPKSKN